MKNIATAFLILFLAGACNTQKQTADIVQNQPRQGQRQGPPSIDDLFKMDANQDGLLSKAEVNGPILNDFAKIDTNSNGYLARTEVENAPKPQKGQGPRRN